ncbi:MAG: sodium:solute symporter family protein [Spirochaetes bacterium]|nr:MAG: sodium:solute symporter family protein [Spirochaetota bacterium]
MRNFLILLGIYIAAGTAISLYVMRVKQSQEDYFIGGRKIGAVLSALTYASTTYSAFMMVGLVGLSYAHGIGAFIFETSYLVATIILLSVYGKKIWQLGKEQVLISPMELFSARYGHLTSLIGAIICFVALIPYTSVQVIGLAKILSKFGEPRITFGTGVIVATLVICIWAFIGGLRGVAITDALQGLFMLGIAVFAVFWTGNYMGGIEISRFPNEFWTPARFINLTLPWCFFALTNPQVSQRLFILRDRNALKRMIILFGIFGFLYTLIVTLMGFSAKYGTIKGIFPQIADRDSVIIEVLDLMMSRFTTWIALPLALSIVFASVSTANSIILSLASMFSRDVASQRENVWWGRIFIIILTAVVGIFSLTRPAYLVELSVASSKILLCFVPLFFGLFHWGKGGRYTGIFALVGGASAGIVTSFFGLSWGSVYTIIIAFILFFLGNVVDERWGIENGETG